jgi:hypothetical protein
VLVGSNGPPIHCSLSACWRFGSAIALEELAVSPGPADIFRWAASDCFDEAGVGDAGDGIGDALDSNRVFPAVAKVVEVFERFGADILQRVAKPGLAGIERPITEVWIRPAPADVASTDLVEMGVRPSQGSLQHEVQAIQADCQRHLDPAHDGRFELLHTTASCPWRSRRRAAQSVCNGKR